MVPYLLLVVGLMGLHVTKRGFLFDVYLLILKCSVIVDSGF
jgi:hypothetical protein